MLALVGALRAILSTHADLALENLALRQQLGMLRRRSKAAATWSARFIKKLFKRPRVVLESIKPTASEAVIIEQVRRSDARLRQ